MSEDNTVFIPDLGFGETEALLKYNVSSKDVEKYEKLYYEQIENGEVDAETKFHYAWCLVHSKSSDVRKALPLLKELFQEGNEQTKRDTLFYLALAEAKLKEYYTAKKHIDAFLSIESNNHQAKQLQSYISSQLVKDGITGMALMGVAAVAGGIAAIAVGCFVLSTGVGLAIVKAVKRSKRKM